VENLGDRINQVHRVTLESLIALVDYTFFYRLSVVGGVVVHEGRVTVIVTMGRLSAIRRKKIKRKESLVTAKKKARSF